jgi:transposase
MFIIGIDPHRGSHMAVAIDRDERIVATIELAANQQQRRRLLTWARPLEPRVWAIEGARGTGALLAQQLVAVGEEVIDVAPKLAARVRVLDDTQSDKCDRHDARSVAIAALRKPSLRRVEREDQHDVFRLLAKRHHDVVAGRTRAVCRLHTTLCYLAEGRFPKRLRADQAAAILARIHPTTAIGVERTALARDLLAEVRRLDHELEQLTTRISDAVKASGTTVTQVHGVGPIVACYLLGHTGNIDRFPNAGHYARYNGTAPVAASTSAQHRHRLNRLGNRQLNHAIHIAAVTQAGHRTIGRDYYLRKQSEGKTRKKALRSLKRQISDAIYRQLIIDSLTADRA